MSASPPNSHAPVLKSATVPGNGISKYETKTAFTDDLFISQPRHKINSLEAWEVKKTINDLRLVFEGTRRLTIQDETVMLAVLHLMGRDGLAVQPEDNDLFREPEIDRKEAGTRPFGVVKESRWRLLALCGLDDSEKSYRQLRESLRRLSSVSVFYQNTKSGWEGQDWFMGYKASRKGEMFIKVNWRLAGSIFGDYHYISLDLNERLNLTHDYAKKLHVVLSRQVWHGQTLKFKLTTLMGHVWPEKDVTEKAIEKRRNHIKKALEEIGTFDAWRIVLEGRGETSMAIVSRAPLPRGMAGLPPPLPETD